MQHRLDQVEANNTPVSEPALAKHGSGVMGQLLWKDQSQYNSRHCTR